MSDQTLPRLPSNTTDNGGPAGDETIVVIAFCEEDPARVGESFAFSELGVPYTLGRAAGDGSERRAEPGPWRPGEPVRGSGLPTCAHNDLVSVSGTGPCTLPDGGVSWGDCFNGCTDQKINVSNNGRMGVCHLVLTFAIGYVFTTDVTFAEHSQGCGCPDYIAANTSVVQVPNPPDTCLPGDAGSDG